jgi:hypothetical protein
MTTITLDIARQNLAALIKRALEGEEIVIATERRESYPSSTIYFRVERELPWTRGA